MRSQRPFVVRGIAAAALALSAGVSGATSAGALTATTQPFMCFNTDHTFHQTFGPNSFFLPETQQGPTSFSEGLSNDHPIVTFPLRFGTGAGHTIYYVITDASDQSVATSLGVNFVPKLANARGSGAVQLSSSNDPTAINVPAGVDFSPNPVLMPSPTGFPPTQPPPAPAPT